MKTTFTRSAAALLVSGLMLAGCTSDNDHATNLVAADLTPAEAQAIAKEAYLYGFPMVVNYKTMNMFAIDSTSPQFKGDFNQNACMARVFTPQDTAVVTPNSDTPYCMGFFDLRTEPQVLTLPEMEAERFFQVQLIDLYTHNYAYISTTSEGAGNSAGDYLLSGPDWDGEVPTGIKGVIRAETDMVFAVTRIQLFNPSDLDNVAALQQQVNLQPLSSYTGTPAPSPAAEISFPAWIEGSQFDGRALEYIDFSMDLASVHSSEQAMYQRFEKLGLGTDAEFRLDQLSPELREAIEAGVKQGFAELEGFIAKTGQDPLSSAKIFGTRDFLTQSAADNYGLDNYWMLRTTAAHMGLYGNTGVEAIYPTYLADSDGQPLNAAEHNYTVTFSQEQLPPVKAFWSLTMYDGKSQLLVDNPMDRYLLNSPMMDQFKFNEDGSLTLYIQAQSPGAGLESNWLPAPEGPFYSVMRLYGPQQAALAGEWSNPPMVKAY